MIIDELEPTDPHPDEVTELRGDEEGRWEVETQKSVHRFDFTGEIKTVTRVPGPGSRPSINDTTRPIRSIETCAVGKSGYWLMEPDHFNIEFYWQRTSIIRRITRCRDEATSGAQ